MRVRYALVTIAIALGLTAGAHAQSTPDAARLELARQVLLASGGLQSAETAIRSVLSATSQIVQEQSPSSQRARAQLLMRAMEDEYVAALPRLIEDSARVYAAHLTEDELRALLDWSKSDVGRSIDAKMPALLRDMVLQQAPLLKEMTSRIRKTVVDQVCAETQCTPQERELMVALLENAAQPPRAAPVSASPTP